MASSTGTKALLLLRKLKLKLNWEASRLQVQPSRGFEYIDVQLSPLQVSLPFAHCLLDKALPSFSIFLIPHHLILQLLQLSVAQAIRLSRTFSRQPRPRPAVTLCRRLLQRVSPDFDQDKAQVAIKSQAVCSRLSFDQLTSSTSHALHQLCALLRTGGFAAHPQGRLSISLVAS